MVAFDGGEVATCTNDDLGGGAGGAGRFLVAVGRPMYLRLPCVEGAQKVPSGEVPVLRRVMSIIEYIHFLEDSGTLGMGCFRRSDVSVGPCVS